MMQRVGSDTLRRAPRVAGPGGKVRNELTAAAVVTGGDRQDEAAYVIAQRDGQLAGAVRMPRAQRVFADLQAVEDLALHRLCTADSDPYTSRPVEIVGGNV